MDLKRPGSIALRMSAIALLSESWPLTSTSSSSWPEEHRALPWLRMIQMSDWSRGTKPLMMLKTISRFISSKTESRQCDDDTGVPCSRLAHTAPEIKPKSLKCFSCCRRCGDSAPPSAPCDRGTSATSPACRTTWGRAASTQWSTKRSRCPSRPCAPAGAFSHCAVCCVTSAPDHTDADFLLQDWVTPPNLYLFRQTVLDPFYAT